MAQESTEDRTATLAPETSETPHAWIVPEAEAPASINPEFAEDDTVILDELELPDGAHAQIIELADGDGVGIVWLDGPPEIGGLPAPDYSPLELSQAYGSAENPVPTLAENHERLAAAGRVPAEARDLLSLGTTLDPQHAMTVERDLCPLGDHSYWFNQWWDFYKKTCPSPTLCGSPSNNNQGVASGNHYLVALSSNKTALQTCNGGAPLGTYSTDLVNVQIQQYIGSGNWTSFYTSSSRAAGQGVVFSSYGFATTRFRMRIYNANNATRSLAAAIW